MEQLGFQINLAVGDGNDVSRDIGRNVAGLSFDDGQRRHRAAAVFRGHAGGTLQQAGMEIEHVAGEGLTSGRTADQQGQGAVGHRVLGKVVIDNEDVLALIHEILAHGTAGIGRDILQRRQLRSSGGDDDGIIHGAVFGQVVHQLGNGGALLPDGDVDAYNALALLVDDGVHGDDGLARLAVADDQLTLTAADGDHGVDGLDARLQRHGDGFSFDDAGGVALDGTHFLGRDGALAVDGLAQSVNHAADECLAHGDGNDLPGALDQTALADAHIGTQHDHADAAFLQVQRHAVGVVFKAQQLVGLALVQTMDLGNAVAHLNDIADFILLCLGGVVFDLILDDLTDIVYFQIHGFTNLTLSYRTNCGAACPVWNGCCRPTARRRNAG